jgi:hypothetical protein
LPWFFAVAERDHLIQNPTSPEKIRRLGELLRLEPKSRVLDIASGRGGPAIILAESFGCHIVGVERPPSSLRWRGRESPKRASNLASTWSNPTRASERLGFVDAGRTLRADVDDLSD